jgi:hypothetical protein
VSMESYNIFLAFPTGGNIKPCAHEAILNCSAKGLRVQEKTLQFGDIPHNFNMLFCEALNGRANGITHFAMLHDDCQPMPGWLDVLIEEMDRVDADIMSTVLGIKDDRGLTTTGVRYPGTWGTRRFVTRELMRLPETFCIADTDEPDAILAIGTACWICRLPKDGWPDRFPGFQNEHKITWHAGEPAPQFDSEDWLFSDWAASQGLRVYSTRKVVMFHQGAKFYPNTGMGGTWETELQRPTRPLTVGLPDPQITIETEHPIAVDSLDHKQPLGSRIDNSSSRAFNRKLFELIPAKDVRLLDLGCSGGGFVRSILDAGGFAVGIEGSDFSMVRKRAEWGTIPQYLFTADATKPFTLRNCTPEPLQFNVVTGWEFWEHIPEACIAGVVENIVLHCAPGACFIGSISSNVEPHHCTAKPRQWWIDRFARCGWTFCHDLIEHFGENVVRGGSSPDGISYSVAFQIKPQLDATLPPGGFPSEWYEAAKKAARDPYDEPIQLAPIRV